MKYAALLFGFLMIVLASCSYEHAAPALISLRGRKFLRSQIEGSKAMIHKLNLSLLVLLVGLFATHGIAQQQRGANSLVGTYHTGHRFGYSILTLEADGNYLMRSSDCTTEYIRSGTYVSSSEGLHFKILKYVAKGHGAEAEINLLDPNGSKRVFGNDSGVATEFELLPITWSDRIYLVDEEDLSNFANAVNFGLEPRADLGSEPYYGSFFLREGDQKKKVSGAPGIPNKWSSLLIRRPVVATIVSLTGGAKETLATLNKGSKSGLRVGMRLLAKEMRSRLYGQGLRWYRSRKSQQSYEHGAG